MDVTFKSFSKGTSASFSSVLIPFIHLWCFQALQLFKISFFFTIPYIDEQLIFLGAKCVWNHSSCEQTSSSIESMIASLEAVLDRPKSFLLFIELFSLNFFNKMLERYKKNNLIFWIINSSKFCKLTNFFFLNHLNDYFTFI